MPKYAQFDSKSAQPAPIVGWYDTDKLNYVNLPAAADLVQLSEAEWAARLDAPMFISGGQIVPAPAPTAAQLAAQFESTKAAALAAVDQFHAQMVQQLAGNPTQVEKDSWAMKLATANEVSANAPVNAAGVAFLTALGYLAPAGATAAAVTAADTARVAWAAKVLTNASNYAGLVGLADSLRTASKAAITAAADQIALDAAIVANRAAADAAVTAAKAKLGIV